MMKTKLFILMICFFSIVSCTKGQNVDYKQDIRKSLTAFIENIKSKRIENAVNFIYPKYLNQVTKEHVIDMLNMAYNNPAFMVDISNFKIDDIEKPEKINDEYFSIANYSFKMKFQVQWSLIPNAEIAKQKINLALKAKYGKDNIQYFDKEDYYLINAKMKACAISQDEKDWKFLILDEKYKEELVNILPEKIFQKF
ncbi:hypothetical protein [Chryseobacterium sp. JM1]|uniref:hypothetical protein n=1 Tax=Chryseobacterium sp. JM1 TaxID=1233950 RepID=UPI00068D008F|nr:hypothetical protein [Chryseobacterium sp. JM1]